MKRGQRITKSDKEHKHYRLFVKVWIVHLLLYFLIQSLFFLHHIATETALVVNTRKIINTIISSPITGLYGILDGIGYLVLFSMIVMYMVNLTIKNYFVGYVLSLLLTYPIFIFVIKPLTIINIITGLLIVVLVNYILIRKQVNK